MRARKENYRLNSAVNRPLPLLLQLRSGARPKRRSCDVNKSSCDSKRSVGDNYNSRSRSAEKKSWSARGSRMNSRGRSKRDRCGHEPVFEWER